LADMKLDEKLDQLPTEYGEFLKILDEHANS